MAGDKRTNNGNNSNRPANISNIKTNFEKSEYRSKFLEGPTSASPGPILPSADATAVRFVIPSKLSMDTSNDDITKIRQYVIKKIFAERSTPCAIGFLSKLIT